MTMLCDIYKSKKKEELYLYVSREEGLERVPEELQLKINCEKPIMTINLSPDRKLSRADVNKVMLSIEETGFYLQMPPSLYDNKSKE